MEVCRASADDIRNFEYGCLGEVRILGAIEHPCIVEMYGHQISSKWIPSVDGHPERRVLQSTILMEYVQGGSLKVSSIAGQNQLLLDLPTICLDDCYPYFCNRVILKSCLEMVRSTYLLS